MLQHKRKLFKGKKDEVSYEIFVTIFHLMVTVMTVSFVRFNSSGTPFRATSLLLIHAAWENANTVKYYDGNSFPQSLSLHNLDTFDRSTGFARSLSYKIFLPQPQRELYFWLSPSAKQRRNVCSGPPAVYHDSSKRHNRPVKKPLRSICLSL